MKRTKFEIFLFLVAFDFFETHSKSYFKTRTDLGLSNPYNFLLDYVSWKQKSNLCPKSCRELNMNLNTRRVIRYDQKSGRCSCFLSAEEKLYKTINLSKLQNSFYYYPGNRAVNETIKLFFFPNLSKK